MNRLLLTGVLAVQVSCVAAAETGANRYAPVADPGYTQWQQHDPRMQLMVDELTSLVNEADRARAADSRFIRDLRDLVARYDWPWTVLLLRDDFSDGDYSQSPVWMVNSGQLRVERGHGLRSVSDPQVATTNNRDQGRDDADLGNLLLGALLNELDKDKDKDKAKTTAPASVAQAEPAVIRTMLQIPDVFAVEAVLESNRATGKTELAVFRETTRLTGYRLAYLAGPRPEVQLLRVTERGTAIIDSSLLKTGLEDGHSHAVQLTRDQAGNMTVTLDNEVRIRLRDRSFQGGFAGIALLNEAGDVNLRNIAVFTAR